MSTTPHIKFEHSPTESLADSFISTPGTQYPSLFDTMDQSELMSPESFDDDSMFGDSISGTPAPEKKQVKKRKSWGQQLPEPKTNLPPRKRAKTEDEKEQRRVERVLRNRRAAQSSRERKRLEVEALDNVKQQLERRVKDMEMQLADERTKRLEAERQLELERASNGKNMTVFRGSSPAHSETFRQAPSPVTFSQELFSSRDGPRQSVSSQYSMTSEVSPQTVNPASLSPEIRPVDEAFSNAKSSDLTQHPAVSVRGQPALDEFQDDSNNNLSNYGLHHGNNSIHQFDYGSIFDAPQPTQSDLYILENQILPLTNPFDFSLDHLDYDHPNGIDATFNIDDFLHQPDEHNQPAPDVQSSDSLAESTASLQPQLGASSYGCDDGGNAVSV